jgi:hypothetical protein
MHQGLTAEESTRRLGVVGPNILDLKKPTVIGSIMKEFSKPFYLYQNFMVWYVDSMLYQVFYFTYPFTHKLAFDSFIQRTWAPYWVSRAASYLVSFSRLIYSTWQLSFPHAVLLHGNCTNSSAYFRRSGCCNLSIHG